MAVNSVVNNAGYYDYHEWDFNLMNWKQRKTFLTRPQANQLTQKLNDLAFKNLFSDKVQFNRRFAPYIGREWLDVRETTPAQLEAFVKNHGSVMLKDPVNLGGYGLEKKDASSIDDFEAFHAHLLASGQVLVEEFLTQHPELSRLSPKSVNTLRVITYFDGTDVHVLAHAFKMGAGADLDNFGQGGIQTTVYDGGVCRYGAFNKAGDKYLVHPQTGVSIVGFVVPLYDEAIALAVELATDRSRGSVRRLGHRDHPRASDRDRRQLQHGRLPDEAEPERHQDRPQAHLPRRPSASSVPRLLRPFDGLSGHSLERVPATVVPEIAPGAPRRRRGRTLRERGRARSPGSSRGNRAAGELRVRDEHRAQQGRADEVVATDALDGRRGVAADPALSRQETGRATRPPRPSRTAICSRRTGCAGPASATTPITLPL